MKIVRKSSVNCLIEIDKGVSTMTRAKVSQAAWHVRLRMGDESGTGQSMLAASRQAYHNNKDPEGPGTAWKGTKFCG